MKHPALALLLALAATSAHAQSARDFPTPNLGERVPLVLQGCLNAAGQVVPCGTPGSIGATTTPGSCAITPFYVTGTGGTLVAANPARKSLRWMNVGAADVTVAPGTAPPVVGQGMVYAATAAGKQGGSEAFNDPAIATNAFAYASATSAALEVWECQ